MSKFDTLVNNKMIQNIFVWVCLFFVAMAIITTSDSRIESSFFALLFILTPTYINNLFILPLLKNKKGFFVIFFLLNCIVFSIFTGFLVSFFTGTTVKPIQFLNLCALLLMATFFGSTIKLARDSLYRQQKKKEAELKLLKAQLNPHFLFNTLNNLYGLSVAKSDKLPDLMLRLSNLLRYSLYETKEQLVPLNKEIEYLKNYISLEKIRLESTEVDFKINGNTSDKKIAPMLFIIFVENAFKYLSSEKRKIDIKIVSKKDKLYFSCKNTTDNVLPEENLKKSKIGLKNAKKRLALMYPKSHILNVFSKKENTFVVDLTLEI